MLNEVMLTEAYLEPSRTSTMELFFFRLGHALKTYLIWPNCLKFHFSHNSPFREKTYHWKLREKKFFVNSGTFFFRNSKLRNGMVPSINRSSHRRCSIRTGGLRNFTKFSGKHCRLSFLIKLQCSPENFVKFLRKHFLQNTSWRLLLNKESFLN